VVFDQRQFSHAMQYIRTLPVSITFICTSLRNRKNSVNISFCFEGSTNKSYAFNFQANVLVIVRSVYFIGKLLIEKRL
jgi:hypothetical protein